MNRPKVVFLDRDGTLIRDRPGYYLCRPESLRLYPYTAEALQRLQKAGYRLVIVTNQSGIGRKLLGRGDLARIHARLRGLLRRRGVRLSGIYFCPHAPQERCRCRKPRTTLARRAVRDLRLTLRGAAVIGDKKADVDLARGLGISSIHVGTGHGRAQREKYGARLGATHSARNLRTAVRWLLRNAAANGSGTD